MEQKLPPTLDSTQQPEGSDNSLLFQLAETAAVAMPLTRGRHKHISSVALLTRDPLAIRVRSDLLTSRILPGLLDEANYAKHPTRNLAEYTQSLPKGRGSVSITLSPHSDESWDHVLASLHLLGDELVDTFLVLLAVALDTNGTEHITAPFTITPDDILAICQKKEV